MIYLLIILHVLTALVLLWSVSLLREGERKMGRVFKTVLILFECANAVYLYQVAHRSGPIPATHNGLFLIECLNHGVVGFVFLLSGLYRKRNIEKYKYETTTH